MGSGSGLKERLSVEEVVRLLEYVIGECREVNSLDKCIQTMAIIRKGVEDIGVLD